MRNLFKLVGIIAMVAVIGFGVVGCEEDNGKQNPPDYVLGFMDSTSTSITVNLTNSRGHGLSDIIEAEFTINTVNELPSPANWQDSGTFTELTPETTYYAFGRSKENSNYKMGPVVSTEVRTNSN